MRRVTRIPVEKAIVDGLPERPVEQTVAIQDRNLAPGTELVAKYKGQTYHVEVVEAGIPGKEGTELRYRVGDKEFTSPSGAGKYVRGSKATNGWTFWSVVEKAAEAPAKAASAPSSRRRKTGSPPGSNEGGESAPGGDISDPDA
jgi:hypothetical protein